MNWEPVYALLILFSSITTWVCGLRIEDGKDGQRRWVISVCIVLNLLILFIFKYFRFVTESIHDILLTLGIGFEVPQFELLLPVGISFYTFQAIGYIMDVYRGEIKAERSFLTYALFVSFFPQLVAGPIERAKNLLPQFHTIHHINGRKMIDGCTMMVWGYFMKLCIAESVAPYVNAVFNNIEMHNGKSIWLASFFFTFQIFCDFCGYTLIAIGVAKCLDFDLMQNFRQPYLAGNIKDFWRRWHISLSSWLSDYVYKPMGGSRCKESRHQRNLIVTFLISGLWHGANWTYVVWGAYHGVLQSAYSLKNKLPMSSAPKNTITTVFSVSVTFIMVLLGWVLFRANSLTDAKIAYAKMLKPSGMLYNGDGKPSILLPLILIAVLCIRELLKEKKWNIHLSSNTNLYISGICTGILIFIILLCAKFTSGEFIYFQF